MNWQLAVQALEGMDTSQHSATACKCNRRSFIQIKDFKKTLGMDLG
uniref:Uncharacterized protein n=1 Tax=Anguilla anguilla TaxID=7936 RepID=A0A0E9VXY5_ANGAN